MSVWSCLHSSMSPPASWGGPDVLVTPGPGGLSFAIPDKLRSSSLTARCFPSGQGRLGICKFHSPVDMRYKI